MIKYNLNNINDWNFGEDNIIKVYRNNAIVFYKFDSETQEFKVCYAVVDDITQYSETEFEDVFNKADGKWYKLNNLNQYEEYGIYGSGRNVTTYDGKLTIDDGYEYEWNGSSWVSVGEVSGSSRVPSGYVELTYAQTVKQYVGSSSAFTIPMDLEQDYKYMCEFTPLDWETSNGNYYGLIVGGIDGSDAYTKWGFFKLDNGWGTMYNRFDACFWTYRLSTNNNSGVVGAYRFYDNVRAKVTMHLHNYSTTEGSDIVVENEGYSTYSGTSTTKYGNHTVQSGSYNMPLFCRLDGGSTVTAYIKFHGIKVETSGGTPVYEYVPCKRESDNKVGLYDVVNNVFYAPQFLLNAGDEASHVTYPKYYSEKSEPLDDLTFNTMEDAVDYAYNNCVYDGMHATIDGDRYYFDSSDENGWVKNQHSLPDVPFTVNYNAKNYNSSTKTLLKTSGQLADVDAVITAGTPTVHDGYLTIATNTRATISGYQTYFNRTNSTPNLTIISKQRTNNNSDVHLFTNRDSNYNWMYRATASQLKFHGSSQINGTNVTTQPVIESVRVDSSRTLKFNNYTDNTTTSVSSFSYGSTNSTATALFAGYASRTGEWFGGDFYWIYMSQTTLTDEQVQQVIDYNENL